MPAYFIVDNEVTDHTGFEEYRKQVPATVEKYGGKFLVRGGKAHPLEGDWPERRRVIIEFPSIEQAKAWYASPEYAKPLALRKAASKGRLVFLEGV